MSTLSRQTKSVKFSCGFVSITIAITDTRYSVDPIDPGEEGTKAFRLTKHGTDPAVYDVLRDHYGLVACTCADWTYRRDGNTAVPCKHGRALVHLGLLEAPDAACCPIDEERPCIACEQPAPNPVAELPDHYPDEPPALDWLPDEEDWAAFGLVKQEWAAQDHLNVPRLSLAELVDHQAVFYRAWGSDAGDLIARTLEELAGRVRWTHAVSPADFEARDEVLTGC